MHLHWWFYLETGSDSHLHCRFYLKNGCDSNFHCRFYLKTGSDVHAPYIKQTAGHIHWSHPPMNSLSLISHISLSLLKTSTLSLRDLVMAPAFSMVLICCLLQYSIYIHLIYIYIHVSLHFTFIYILIPCIRSIFNYVATFYFGRIFLCIYFMFIFFFAFYRWGGMNNGPPPPQEPGFHSGDEPFAPNMAIPRFPVLAIVWNIFQHLLFFDANK